MKTYVALLRAVNLAGRNRVRMSALRELLGDLGFRDPRSLLQSGNLVFQSDDRGSARLESMLEDAAEEHLGLATHFFVRDVEEWNTIIANNPFPDQAEDDPSHLLVVLLKRTPRSESIASLQSSIPGREVVEVDGRCAYIVYPDGIGRSRLTNALIEKALGTSGTGRNWNTVLKVRSLAQVAT